MLNQRIIALIVTATVLLAVGSAVAQQPPPGTPPPRPGEGDPPPRSGDNTPPPRPEDSGNPPPQGGAGSQPPNDEPLAIDESFEAVASSYIGIGSISTGSATGVDNPFVNNGCSADSGYQFEEALSGPITALDGTVFTVPSEVTESATCTNVYDECTLNGQNPEHPSYPSLQPTIIDDAGQIITGYLFGDNFYELHVNGQFVCHDSVGFTPFNSTVVRFQAQYPITYAVRLVDWETHQGLGMEYDRYNVGDGGFIANFDDGTTTDAEWKCQPFYIAPLDDPACVVEDANGNRDSSACSERPQCAASNPEACRALHYELPEDWMMPEFDDSAWPVATKYAGSEVTSQPGYSNYANSGDIFGDIEFIWSSNLDLDNMVICRLTVDGPQ